MQQLTLVEHPPQPTVEASRLVVAPRRVTSVDRVVLHLGLALILWSRRRYRHRPTHEQHRIVHAHTVATARREREAERRALLTFSIR